MTVPYSTVFLGLLLAYMIYSQWARLDSRLPIAAALGLLVITAIVDALGNVTIANVFAEYVFFLLAGGVVLLLADHVRESREADRGGSPQADGPQGGSADPMEERQRATDQHLVEAKPSAFHSTDSLEFLRDVDLHTPRHLRRWGAAIFWIAMGLGILTKGVTPIFVFTTAIALSITMAWPTTPTTIGPGHKGGFVPWWGRLFMAVRRQSWRWFGALRPIWGIVLLCVVVLPWFIAAWLQTHGALIERMIGQNVLKRTTSGLQSHGEPPGFYLATIWGTFWPWSVLLVPAGFHAVRRARRIGPIAFDPSPYQFLLCWIIPSWLLFECFVTKMVEYDLPLFIPLAILCADTMVQSWHRLTDVLSPPWFAGARWIWSGIWIVLGGGVLLGCWHFFLPNHPREFSAFVPAAVALAATGVAGAIVWNRPPWPLMTVLGFGLSLILLNAIALPQLKGLDLSRRAGTQMALMASRGYRLGAVGYVEPSLVFYSRAHVRLFSSPAQMAKIIGLQWPGSKKPCSATHPWCVAVDQRSLKYLRAHHYRFRRLDWFHGFKVAKGKLTTVTLITTRLPKTDTDTVPPGLHPPSTVPEKK